MGKQPRILVVCFPGQGHINPSLQLAKRLLRASADVTFSISAAAHRRMSKDAVPDSLTVATYSDGYEDIFEVENYDFDEYMASLRTHSSRCLGQIMEAEENAGRPFTCVVYAAFLPWVASVARKHHVPSVLHWVQPAAVFRIYHYYFDTAGPYGAVIRNSTKDPSAPIELPGLLPLTSRDLPSILLPSASFFSFSGGAKILEEHHQILKEEANSKVLVNTFDALEEGPLGGGCGNPELIAVGPLVSSAVNSADTGCGDLFRGPPECIQWLDSWPEGSVVYVSFGSYSVLPKPQVEEVARALLDSGRPFLWVIRKLKRSEAGEEPLVSCREELERLGKIVTWCPQVEVLSRPAVGCFVTHCGWNSTLESIVWGVPMVACPLWTDQATNARLVEGAWGTGVRVEKNDEGIVEAGELRRCLEMVMGGGEAAAEMRKKAAIWKELAREAVSDGGSSDQNLKAFVGTLVADEVCT